MAGGRELWAIPKELADFRVTRERGSVRERTSWSVDVDGRPVVRARFTDASRLLPRVPLKGATWQPPIDDHAGDVVARLTGSSRVGPCRSDWDIAPDGPLGWLAGARRLASFRQDGFRMTFG
ncbi:MAG: acetoacetate decarboxylase family protein [Nocardioides sp.]